MGLGAEPQIKRRSHVLLRPLRPKPLRRSYPVTQEKQQKASSVRYLLIMKASIVNLYQARVTHAPPKQLVQGSVVLLYPLY